MGEDSYGKDFFDMIAQVFPQKPGEQPALEEQTWFCFACMSTHQVVVDVDEDFEYMCPDCHSSMKKV